MTLWSMDRLPKVRNTTPQEATALYELSNHVYDALERFQLSEARRDDLANVMIEVATKFLERGL